MLHECFTVYGVKRALRTEQIMGQVSFWVAFRRRYDQFRRCKWRSQSSTCPHGLYCITILMKGNLKRPGVQEVSSFATVCFIACFSA